jgi:hypothetical protein
MSQVSSTDPQEELDVLNQVLLSTTYFYIVTMFCSLLAVQLRIGMQATTLMSPLSVLNSSQSRTKSMSRLGN